MRQRGWRLFLKKAFDRTSAFLALIVLSPVMLLVSIAVAVSMGFPILFRDDRPGYRSRLFTIYKFRTMHAARSREEAHIERDAARLTRTGVMLRRWSLDELPQLFNVLRGELSLVGPRPLLAQYLTRYSERQAKRHDVMPGITGWAQVHGRNAVKWEDRFELDVWYVENWSLVLDLKIILLTLVQLLRHHQVTHPGYASMPEFLGKGHESR